MSRSQITWLDQAAVTTEDKSLAGDVTSLPCATENADACLAVTGCSGTGAYPRGA